MMPPSPELWRGLRDEYKQSGVAGRITFNEYLRIVRFTDPSAEINGMDDSILLRSGPSGAELFSIPQFKVAGKLEIIVLLVDFADMPATRPKSEYESLLFGTGVGSLADYYAEVSCGKVQIAGTVHGWLRMPKTYAQYTNGKSGMNPSSYPDNAQGMAEDTVRAALAQGVAFSRSLDKLNQGVVTALFIVHAGPGAEVLQFQRDRAIWSHKWNLREPMQVAPGLAAAVYLTVPEDCKVGVCAHELGHLAFQWEDFYDANYNEDGDHWDGSGDWDLMASGSYNGEGSIPAYPAGLHRVQHGWIEAQRIALPPGSKQAIELAPNTALIVKSRGYRPGQYLLLENRQNKGFDAALPGHGLLVWRVDETQINTTSVEPGLFLLEADANNSFQPGDFSQGEAGDPFPGASGATRISDSGRVSTTFPGFARSGIVIDSIVERDGVVGFELSFG